MPFIVQYVIFTFYDRREILITIHEIHIETR